MKPASPRYSHRVGTIRNHLKKKRDNSSVEGFLTPSPGAPSKLHPVPSRSSDGSCAVERAFRVAGHDTCPCAHTQAAAQLLEAETRLGCGREITPTGAFREWTVRTSALGLVLAPPRVQKGRQLRQASSSGDVSGLPGRSASRTRLERRQELRRKGPSPVLRGRQAAGRRRLAAAAVPTSNRSPRPSKAFAARGRGAISSGEPVLADTSVFARGCHEPA